MQTNVPGGRVTPEVGQLLVSVYMTEYTALRQEVLLDISRVSNLVIYSIVGSGALVGSAAVTSFADRPEVFVSLLFLIALVLGLVSATCVGVDANILVINDYLAKRSDEIRDVLNRVAGDPTVVKPKAFSWETQSIGRPKQMLTPETATTWGGPILEILVVVVLAVVTFVAAAWIYSQHQEARTLLTTSLLVLDVLAGFAIAAWAPWTVLRWNRKAKDSTDEAIESKTTSDPKSGE